MFEAKRKLIHVVGLSVPVVYWATSKEITVWFVSSAVFCAILIEFARFRWESFRNLVFKIIGGYAREQEETRITGATYYSVAALIVVVVFPQKVAVSSLLFLTLGDSVAALVGTSVGYHKIFDKSVEGSAACFAVCTVVGWWLLGWVGVGGAAAATIIELVPVSVDDNLRIPVVAGCVMYGLTYLL